MSLFKGRESSFLNIKKVLVNACVDYFKQYPGSLIHISSHIPANFI